MICSSTQKIKVYSKHGILLKTMADELAEYYFVKAGSHSLPESAACG